LRPKAGVDVTWLHFSLRIRPDVGEMITGTTRPKLNQEIAVRIPVPLPSLSEQKCLASELQEKMTQAEKLKEAIAKQMDAIKALPQAILRKAFTGEM